MRTEVMASIREGRVRVRVEPVVRSVVPKYETDTLVERRILAQVVERARKNALERWFARMQIQMREVRVGGSERGMSSVGFDDGTSRTTTTTTSLSSSSTLFSLLDSRFTTPHQSSTPSKHAGSFLDRDDRSWSGSPNETSHRMNEFARDALRYSLFSDGLERRIVEESWRCELNLTRSADSFRSFSLLTLHPLGIDASGGPTKSIPLGRGGWSGGRPRRLRSRLRRVLRNCETMSDEPCGSQNERSFRSSSEGYFSTFSGVDVQFRGFHPLNSNSDSDVKDTRQSDHSDDDISVHGPRRKIPILLRFFILLCVWISKAIDSVVCKCFVCLSALLYSLVIRALKTGDIPRHVAFIMDGNRRWSRLHQVRTLNGHLKGYDSMEKVLEYCRDLGVQVVSVYAFSIDNFRRSQEEVEGLMRLASRKIRAMLEQHSGLIEKYDCRVRVVGDLSLLPCDLQDCIEDAMHRSAHAKSLVLNICMPYTSFHELSVAATMFVKDSPSNFDSESSLRRFDSMLSQFGCDHVDLLIRTSGEHRLSNFLLWQCTDNTWISFTSTLWPDLRWQHLMWIVLEYQIFRLLRSRTS